MRARPSMSIVLAATALVGLAGAPASGDDAPANGASAVQEVVPGVLLKVGDKAPALAIEEWVKGSPVSGFEKGRTYVVEFWATWCGPCKVSIPHLTELQAKHTDKLTIIGISSSEQNGVADVREFVKAQGDNMAYTVAWDDAGRTNKAYMEASGSQYIPWAYIVNGDGHIAWIGSPFEGFDRALAKVLDGTWDVAKEGEKMRKADEFRARIMAAQEANDEAKMVGAAREMVEAVPEYATREALFVFQYDLTTVKDYDKAYAYATRLVDDIAKDDHNALNGVAWLISAEEGVERRDLDLALRAGERAAELTKHKDAQVLDTLARVHSEKGDHEKAIATQRKAIEVAKGSREKRSLEKNLAELEAKKK